MKKNFVHFMTWPTLLAMMVLGIASAQKPAAPENLTADVVAGHKVVLNWENPDAADKLLETGFEGENPFAGWTIDSTNTFDLIFTWFSYPESRFIDEEDDFYQDYIHSGEQSAMVYFDPYIRGTHKRHQDEWLISPVMNNAAYLKFNYYIDPMILEYGMDDEFPDHYVVVVSKDGGETWGEPLWDARYDASEEPGWAMAVLALDEEPSDNMKIAFRAYGDYRLDGNGDTVNEGLYFMWCIDDVEVSSSLPAVTAEMKKIEPTGKTYREYAMSSEKPYRVAKRANPHAKMPLIHAYDILLDDEIIATGIQNCSYTDKSEKTAGKHQYTVVAVSGDEASEPASVEVEIAEVVFAEPGNVVCYAEKDEEAGDYIIYITWEDPESDFLPVYYSVYCDGEQIGWEITDYELSQWGYTAGVYEFAVEAVYAYPDGVSEPVVRRLALDVRFGVSDLVAEMDGKDVVLSWEAPETDAEHPMGTYTVYRSEEKVAEGLKETTWRDKEVAAGLYQYTVIAVYADNEASVRATVNMQVGAQQRVDLPYEQKFNTTFCPENMRVVNLEELTPDKYVWYFDDGSRTGINGNGFDGGYAVIDCYEAGFYPVDAALELPAVNLEKEADKSRLKLSFYYSYASDGSDKAGVEWSLDGNEWYMLMEVEGYDPAEVDGEDFYIQRVEKYIGEDPQILVALERAGTLYLRFHYTGTDAYHFAVDNVMVTGSGTAVEGLAEDPTVVVAAADGLLKVQAAQVIRLVEVYALDGRKVAERIGGEATELTVPVAQREPAVVRITTAQGVKTIKILL